jgi:energy-converting hydrogenase Eha subunit F
MERKVAISAWLAVSFTYVVWSVLKVPGDLLDRLLAAVRGILSSLL